MKGEALKELQRQGQKESDMRSDLISIFARLGVVISLNDIDQILTKGADAFLIQKGVTVPEKQLVEIYIILCEIKML